MSKRTYDIPDELLDKLSRQAGREKAETGKTVAERSIVIRAIERELATKAEEE